MHRHEDAISADQREQEVDSRQVLVHHSAKHLREPVVSRGEDAKDGGYTHDQMEMSGDERRVVQRNIKSWLREKWAAESARNKQRYKANGKKHGRSELDATAPEGTEPIKRLDG